MKTKITDLIQLEMQYTRSKNQQNADRNRYLIILTGTWLYLVILLWSGDIRWWNVVLTVLVSLIYASLGINRVGSYFSEGDLIHEEYEAQKKLLLEAEE